MPTASAWRCSTGRLEACERARLRARARTLTEQAHCHSSSGAQAPGGLTFRIVRLTGSP
jgi:hypothetical protein